MLHRHPAQRLLALLDAHRDATIAAAGSLTAGIAFTDWIIEPNISLGFLYIFPIMLAGIHLARLQIMGFALCAAILREVFSPFRLEPAYLQRIAVVSGVFAAAGILISELLRNYRLTRQHLVFRERADRRLRAIVETSPVAVVTFDASGRILLANNSGYSLLGIQPSAAGSESILRYLDALAVWLENARENWRTELECRGQRKDGTLFLAHVWLSTYAGDSGLEFAAFVWDASEQLRVREDTAMDAMAGASRILVGAVSHEVRNLASTAAILSAALAGRHEGIRGDSDYQALGSVLRGLESLASSGLQHARSRTAGAVELGTVLDEFRIILGLKAEEQQADLVWDVPRDVPAVIGEHSGLLQVLLNLADNSLRALQFSNRRVLSVKSKATESRITLLIGDTGPGVPDPDNLFRPFASGSNGTGLGLYVSRGIVRSFGGDLRFQPEADGACFAVELERFPDRGPIGSRHA